jgi:TolB protein
MSLKIKLGLVKLGLFATLLAMSIGANAQLVIEITRGQANATPIAVVPLGWSASMTPPFDVSLVIESDLKRTGQFAPVERRDMIDRPTTGTEIRFLDWKALKSDYIVVGKLLPDGVDRYQIQYNVFNVLTGRSLLDKKPTDNGAVITATTKTLRSTAHQVANRIYETITGIRGVFDTRIAYITVETVSSNKRYSLIVSDADGENAAVPFYSADPIMSPAWSPDGQSLAYVSFERCYLCTDTDYWRTSACFCACGY